MADFYRQVLINTYRDAVRGIRESTIGQASVVFDTLPNYRDEGSEQLVELVVPQLLSAQREIASLTSAYIARMNSTIGADSQVVTPDFEQALAPRGIDPAQVYARPMQTLWNRLSKGADFEDAKKAARQRLEKTLATDMQLTKVSTAKRSMENSGVQFYRRVPEGEYSCLLCLVASTQHYRTGELMPIHPGCDCSVAPLPSNPRRWKALDGSWRVIDPALLEAAHQEAGLDTNRSAIGYEQLITTVQHGEIGPVLALAQHVVKAKARQKNQSGNGEGNASGGKGGTGSIGAGSGGSGKGYSPTWQHPDKPNKPHLVRKARTRSEDPGVNWDARQDALGIPTNGEVMNPHEIELVEELQRLGHPPTEWLPQNEYYPEDDPKGRKGNKPSNDMIWHGHQFEAKRVQSLKYSAVKAQIATKVKKAKEKGAVKNRFIIDFGGLYMSTLLERQLRQYNLRNPHNRIKELWVLDGEGLHQIHLRNA